VCVCVCARACMCDVMRLHERGSIYACVWLSLSLFLCLSVWLAGWLSCCLCISACACVMYVAAGHKCNTQNTLIGTVGLQWDIRM